MTSIANRYRILSELGQGGMGTVYKAEDTLTQIMVAVKHLKRELTTPDLIERFKREGEALRELNHPNIVKMLDAVEEDGNYYLIIEYLSGGDLNDLLKHNILPIEKVLSIAIDICDALTRAHRLNIIHRDLKPANVLIAGDATPHLSDFGVARIGQKKRVTATDMIVGTIDYLAPEALDGAGIDERADIWAFGVMLFEMVAGKRPFSGESLTATLTAILTHAVPDLESLRPDAPIALIDLIYRMLEKDPHARIRSVRQVGLELEDILHGRTTQTPPQTRFAANTPTFILRPKHNLPAQTTPFVGREAELGELTKLLNDPKIRLITIVAQGGMGKTRLALETAERQIPSFENGVYFVELAPLSDSVNIVSTIADATSYTFQADGREQKQQILDFLGNKNMLLVLDNYEHLLDGASLVTDILKAAPGVKILATSRQRLNQLSETIFNLQGMDFPVWETPADALEYAAVKLFMQSAKRAQPGFELTADNMDAIARICKLVQGMPLGIVMAAAWLLALPPDEIAAEIAASIDFLASNMGEIPERQRSMRVIFDYSWNLMTEAEQQVFMKLSVFKGGFTRNAGQAVTGANLQDLLSLVNKSLLRRDNDSGRYDIHELLRQYAAARSEEAGQTEATQHAHMLYYANAMYEREKQLTSHGQLEAINNITADFENVRAAWIWAVEQKHFEVIDRMQESLRRYCALNTRFEDGITLFNIAIQGFTDSMKMELPTIYGRLLTRLSLLYAWSRQSAQGYQLAEMGLQIAREQGERHEMAVALLALADQKAEREQAQAFAEESLALFRETGDSSYMGDVLSLLGYLEANTGQYEQGVQLWLEGLHLSQKMGNKARSAILLANLGVYEVTIQRRYDRAEAYYREALVIGRELRMVQLTCKTLANLAALYENQGQLDIAETMSTEGLHVAQEANYRLGMIASLSQRAYLKIYREDYEAALNFADEAMKLVQSTDDSVISGDVKLVQGMILCAKGDYIAAEKVLRSTLPAILSNIEIFRLVDCVLGFSLLLAFHYQEHERALALASLVAHHPTNVLGDTHPLAKRLITHLQQQLTADVYAAAWEQGKSLDFDTVVKELLEEFGEYPAA